MTAAPLTAVELAALRADHNDRNPKAGHDWEVGPICRLLATVDDREAEVATLRQAMRRALDPDLPVNDAWRLLAEHVGWVNRGSPVRDQPAGEMLL